MPKVALGPMRNYTMNERKPGLWSPTIPEETWHTVKGQKHPGKEYQCSKQICVDRRKASSTKMVDTKTINKLIEILGIEATKEALKKK